MVIPEVVDLFCGVGGLTRGLSNVGLNVLAGFDIDPTCQYAYTHNNSSVYHLADIREVAGEEIKSIYSDKSIKVLVGCAPCQPFSQLRSKLGQANLLDEKYTLLNEFGRIIKETEPDIISMENVPQLMNSNVYQHFISLLTSLGYYYDAKVVKCSDYGISQGRRRFVLVGSKYGEISLIEPTHKDQVPLVRDFISNLPELKAGEQDVHDPLHRCASMSEKNLKRIRASLPGGSWEDWPEELRCECHKKPSGKTYKSVYGRMSWDQIGPTITTEFYNYGTGRFGHPDQDRALSLREGALLQTFPLDYDFVDPNSPSSFSDIARHIGNAVPVRLGEIIGQSIITHVENIMPNSRSGFFG